MLCEQTICGRPDIDCLVQCSHVLFDGLNAEAKSCHPQFVRGILTASCRHTLGRHLRCIPCTRGLEFVFSFEDFAHHGLLYYAQPWYLIAHGNFDPYSTTFPPSFFHSTVASDDVATGRLVVPLASRSYPSLAPRRSDRRMRAALLFIWMCEITRESDK